MALAKIPVSRIARDPVVAGRAAQVPTRASTGLNGYDPHHLPQRYRMMTEGDCLSPVITHGSRLEFSTVERLRPGDFVAIFRKAEFVKPAEWQVVVKRLVLDARKGDVTIAGVPGDGRGLLVEMLNPPQLLYFPAEQIETVHRMVQAAPEGDARWTVSPAEARAIADAQVRAIAA